MEWLLGALGLGILLVVVSVKKLGPKTLDDAALARATPILRVTRDDPGEPWSGVGSRTRVRGLDLGFDHDDDPEAEATLRVPGAPERPASTSTNVVTVRLSDTFATHHVHSAGYVFRLSLRGAGEAVGRETRIQMVVSGGKPVGGRIENDDDDQAAVGGWIEIAWAEVLRVAPS